MQDKSDPHHSEESAISENREDRLRPMELAEVHNDLTRHYSNLRFIILPLFGVAVGAPVLFAHSNPIGDTEQNVLAVGLIVGATIFASMLIRAQMLIDDHSAQLLLLLGSSAEDPQFSWIVIPKNPAAWGSVFRVLTGVGCFAVAIIAAYLVLQAPTTEANPPTFIFCAAGSDLAGCQVPPID